MPRLIIEISPDEPRASACLMDGSEVTADIEVYRAMRDCIKGGDAEPACTYVRDQLGVEFRIVAKDAAGAYENRLATDAELQATCEAIYFESETDFSEQARAQAYLIWEAAMEFDTGAD